MPADSRTDPLVRRATPADLPRIGRLGALLVIVDPEFRGHGIGRLLLEATLADLKSRGAPRVVLTTADGNEAAHRLFADVGFRRTMIEMTRELDDPAKPA